MKHSQQRRTTLYATDRPGSLLAQLQAGQPDRFAYTPFGHRSPAAGIGFNGELPDPLTGHYLLGNGHRAYNPVLMRFNSPDRLSPFGKGGVNAYAYCGNDPVNRSDPSGQFAAFNAITLFLRTYPEAVMVVSTLLFLGGGVAEAFPGRSEAVSTAMRVVGVLGLLGLGGGLIKYMRVSRATQARFRTQARVQVNARARARAFSPPPPYDEAVLRPVHSFRRGSQSFEAPPPPYDEAVFRPGRSFRRGSQDHEAPPPTYAQAIQLSSQQSASRIRRTSV
ncbi:RHS repeat-associated core domain-containing protein [Pseudomonas ovata]|uniref:RHS repeat-associated core domain-containing protein n=1 Tax=Pseudomonas ovata TaxID=1839709 RepID=UPI001F4D69CA|nr:RHS repeat-associated core domain-containing protein [Pseudomonas ovata]